MLDQMGQNFLFIKFYENFVNFIIENTLKVLK